MQLDRLAIVARIRRPWEAVDLGFTMARAWWAPLFWSWLLPSSALLLLLDLVTFFRWPGAFVLAVWWLKPFWDRLPLFIASRALFGEQVRLGAALRAFPALARRDALAWLTWRRLSTTRSFDLPVTVLEALEGEARARRIALLHGGSGGAAAGLTIACAHFELVILFGLYGAVYLLIPTETDVDLLDWLTSEGVAVAYLQQWLFHGAAALVAPFYTMGGFALYLARRMELEAWDIEIRFRHLAQRSGGAARPSAAASTGGLAAALALAAFALLAATPAQAVEAATPGDERMASRSLIEEVLQDEAFHQSVREQGWRLKSREPSAQDPLPEWLIELVESLESVARWLGERESMVRAIIDALELVVGAALIGFALYLLHRHRDVVQRFVARSTGAAPDALSSAPEVLVGLDVRAAALPEDVPGEVLRLRALGRSREGLSLLYRATLARLVTRAELRFSERMTEEECLEIVRRGADAPLTDYFLQLTRCWQRLAYGHREPGGSELEQLCAGFRERLHA